MTKYPLLYISIVFACGVAIASGMIAVYVAAIIYAALFVGLPVVIYRDRPTVWLVIIIYLSFAAGVVLTQVSYINANSFAKYDGENGVVTGKIIDVQTTEAYKLLELSVNTVNDHRETGKLSIFVMNTEKDYTYGEEAKVRGKINIPREPEAEGKRDYRARNYTDGIKGTIITGSSDVEILGSDYSVYEPGYIGYQIRSGIKHILRACLSPDQAELMIALMLGDKNGISIELEENIKHSGTAHIVAVSGLHVSIFLLFFMTIVRFFSYRYKKANIIGLISLAFLCIILSGSPSISRAILSALLFLSAGLLDKRSEPFTNIAISALFILIIQPYALMDLRFILSFASITGIITLTKLYTRRNGLLSKMLYPLLTCICASVGPLMFIANTYGYVTVLGIVTNVVAIPLVGLILPLGCIACIAGFIWMPAAWFIGCALNILLVVLDRTLSYGAALPYASIAVPKPDFLSVCIYISACCGVYFAAKLIKEKRAARRAALPKAT